MIGTNIHEAPIQPQVIDTIGVGRGNGGMREVMPIDLFRFFHFTPLTAFVVKWRGLVGERGYYDMGKHFSC
jgi:hypothetical protein